MTEQKPYGYAYHSLWSGKDTFSFNPPPPSSARDVRPLYEHPAPAQPATDPTVEAARRKALRAIFKALAKHAGAGDWTPVMLTRAVLRDLVGEARRDPLPVEGYDFRECE